jgi:tripartite-type tricarboxylate transporter receptor subunit TctC
LAPAGTPQPIVVKLNAAMKTAMTEPNVIKVLDQSGTDVVASSPEEFGKFIADETKLWHGVLNGMTIDKE